jgi:DnaJ family protein C protein 7
MIFGCSLSLNWSPACQNITYLCLLLLQAISRRSSLYELIRDYEQAENDLRRLITLLEKQLQENMSMPSEKVESIRSNLNRANLRFSSLQRDARKGASLNVYMIL